MKNMHIPFFRVQNMQNSMQNMLNNMQNMQNNMQIICKIGTDPFSYTENAELIAD